jgi:hypothetical protein
MDLWHRRPLVRVMSRLAGLALLLALWPTAASLRGLVRDQPGVTPAQLLLAAAGFLCAATGLALLVIGADLWRSVTVAARWREPFQG